MRSTKFSLGMKPLDIRAHIAEFGGTFLLVFGILIIVEFDFPQVALLIGIWLTGIVYLTGPVSNAHLNPSISIGFWVRGDFPFHRVVTYILVQMLGSFLAISLFGYFFEFEAISPNALDPYKAGIGEAIGTCLLAAVIWSVATLAKTSGNNYYGVAIGGIVAIGILLFGSWSGAYFNPATLAMGYARAWCPGDLLTVLLPIQFLSSIATALIFNLIFGKQ